MKSNKAVNFTQKNLGAAILLASCAATSGVLSARESGGTFALEEIVVTAQKRHQSLQDVSVSVAVVGGDDIYNKALVNMEEVTANLPAVTIARNVLSQYIFVRGLGTASIVPAQEQAVAMFTDGIYMGRPTMARAPLMDIDRVEVLRGSQSIFFGKNTLAGAIGIYTKEPTEEFEGKVSVLYGSDNEREFNTVVSGPLSDSVSARMALRKYDIDGWLQNTLPGGEDAVQSDDLTGRLKVAWDINETATLKVSYENNKYDSIGGAGQFLTVADYAPASTLAALGLVDFFSGGTEDYEANNRITRGSAISHDSAATLGLTATQLASLPDSENTSEARSELFVADYEQDLGATILTTVLGYAKYDTFTDCDCDIGPLPLLDADSEEEYEQTSIEIRIVSNEAGRVDYLAGLFYQSNDLSFQETNIIGLPVFFRTWNQVTPLLPALVTPNIGRIQSHDQKDETISIFGSLTWHMTDSFRSALGLRVQNEKKEAFQSSRTFINDLTVEEYDVLQATDPVTVGITDPVGFQAILGTFEHDFRDRLDEDTLSWSLKFEYDLPNGGLLYALASNGNKSGGFDARSVQPQSAASTFSYNPEKALNFEVGVKQELMGGRMRVNADIFTTDVEDYQVTAFDGTINFFINNAGELRSRGLEVDASFLVTETLQISAALAYLDSEWLEFGVAPATALQSLNGMATQDLKGERAPFAPEYAGNLSIEYSRPVGAYLFDAKLDINYSDEYSSSADMDPYGFHDAWTTVGLRLAISSADDAWKLALIGKNLTDEVKGNAINDVPLYSGVFHAQIDRLRSVALQAIYRF